MSEELDKAKAEMIELAWKALSSGKTDRLNDLRALSALGAGFGMEMVPVILLCHAGLAAERPLLRTKIIETILVALGERP